MDQLISLLLGVLNAGGQTAADIFTNLQSGAQLNEARGVLDRGYNQLLYGGASPYDSPPFHSQYSGLSDAYGGPDLSSPGGGASGGGNSGDRGLAALFDPWDIGGQVLRGLSPIGDAIGSAAAGLTGGQWNPLDPFGFFGGGNQQPANQQGPQQIDTRKQTYGGKRPDPGANFDPSRGGEPFDPTGGYLGGGAYGLAKTGITEGQQLTRDAMGRLEQTYFGEGGQGGGDWNNYLAQNPDVAAAAKASGQNPQDYARMHYENYGKAEGRQLPAGGTVGAWENLAKTYGQKFDPIVSGNQDRWGGIEKGYTDLRDRLMGYLEGQGETERADINQAFDNRQSGISADLVNRGLSASTVGIAGQTATERERAGAQGDLNERLRNARIGLDQGTTSAIMGAKQGALGDWTGLSQTGLSNQTGLDQQAIGQRQGAGENITNQYIGLKGPEIANATSLGQYPLGLQRAGMTDLLSLLTGVNISGPDPGSYLNLQSQLGTAGVGPPSYDNNTFGQIFAPIAGGAAAGGAAALATTKAAAASGTYGAGLFFCVDADANVVTQFGRKRIRELVDGDAVLGSDDAYHTVKHVALGPPHGQRFVRLRRGRKALVVTEDHIVEGLPAGEWPDIAHADACDAGDLEFTDGWTDYIAEGFIVTSMYPRAGGTLVEHTLPASLTDDQKREMLGLSREVVLT